MTIMTNTEILKFMVNKFNQYNLDMAISSGMAKEDAEKYSKSNEEYVFIILSKVFKDMSSNGYINV